MNNRQANGRRRGRGGQQQQRSGGGSNQRDNGNRIDSRARGNAAQLLEKYKNLARDAQMQGDRVNTEYYLQFADHYFRVLSETRSRFEENNPGQQAPRISRPDLEDDDFGMEGETGREDGNQSDQREERQARDDRDDNRRDDNRGNRDQGRDQGREERQSREDRPREDRPREERQSRDDRPREDRQRNGRANGNANGNGQYRGEAPQQDEGFEPRREGRAETRDEPRDGEQPRRRANTRPRRDEAPEAEAPSGLDLAVLPPAIAIVSDAPAVEVKEKPRRGRPRRDADAPTA